MKSNNPNIFAAPKDELAYFTPGKSDRYFPYAILAAGQSTFCPDRPIVTKRYHNHTLIFTTHGAGRLSLNGQLFDATASSVIWLNTSSNYAHGCHPDFDHWSYIWFGMAGFGLDALCAEHVDLGSPVFQAQPDLEKTFIEALHHLQAKEIQKGVRSTAIASQVLSVLLARASLDVCPPEYSSPHEVLSLVRSDLSKKWSVASMAALISISTPHFHRLFRREFGLAPMEWLRIERINSAKYLLASTNDRVAHIGRQCGFSDPYHFSREFTRTAGKTPSAFRKSAING